jgi:hypothetical protein
MSTVRLIGGHDVTDQVKIVTVNLSITQCNAPYPPSGRVV